MAAAKRRREHATPRQQHASDQVRGGKRLPLIKRFAHALGVIAIGVAVFAWWEFPLPYPLVFGVLAPLPWLALLLTAARRDQFSLTWSDKGEAFDTLISLLVIPGLVLAWLSAFEFNLADWGHSWWLALVYALTGGILMAAIAALCCPRLRAGHAGLVMLALAAAFYGHALAQSANVWLDSGTARIFRVPIVALHSEPQGKLTSRYFLRLAPWGPHTAAQDYEVDRDTYHGRKAGEAACVLVHPGLLLMPWYEVQKCASGGDL